MEHNNYKLVKLNMEMGKSEYEMYQDIENIPLRSLNPFLNKKYNQFKIMLKNFIDEENIKDVTLDTTTNRYVFYIDNKPIGEFGIRTTLNDFWINKGSQIFYKIRKSEQGKGYGNLLIREGLKECKRLGFKQIRANCEDSNISSKQMLLKAGFTPDKHYENNSGKATSYIIKL